MGEIRACGLCGGHVLDVLLDMGSQPLAENYHVKERFPLVLMRCRECTLLQLSYQVPPKLLFPPDHPYASANSGPLVNSHRLLATSLCGGMKTGEIAVDIGCNDGTLLDGYLGHGVHTIGVEPTGMADRASAKGHVILQRPWDYEAADVIREEYGQAKVITATNVLAHVPDPHGFCQAVYHLLREDGMFVTENGDAEQILGAGLQIDTVYHEHLRYYTVATAARLLAKNGLQVIGCERTGSHGGSFRLYAWKDTYLRKPGELTGRAVEMAAKLRDLVGSYPDGQVWGIAASTRATPLIHYTGIASAIYAVTEPEGSEKIGTVIPGTGIPVVAEPELIANQPQAAVLFAWHIKDMIIPKLRLAGYKGSIITPLPSPEVDDGD